MMWLAVDAKLRDLTHDAQVARRFRARVLRRRQRQLRDETYTFDDVVAALNGVARRTTGRASCARAWRRSIRRSLDGLAASGWKLVYTDKQSAYREAVRQPPESARHLYDFAGRSALTLIDQGQQDQRRALERPGVQGRHSTGRTLVAVNGREFTPTSEGRRSRRPEAARRSNCCSSTGDVYRTFRVDYHDGLQYPHLVRIDGTPDHLTAILAPRK